MSKKKGFTIIEVMIVLAIAAAILLIVFVAVPGLQSSSRNTQRKGDVSQLLSAVSQYQANTNGALPTTSGQFNSYFGSFSPRLVYYRDWTLIQWRYSSSAYAAAPAVPTDIESVDVYNYLKCNSNNNGATTSTASVRSIIALFRIETRTSTYPQCLEL